MPCWDWVAPLIWCWLHPLLAVVGKVMKVLLNKGMKYWDSGLNAPGSRRFRAILRIAAAAVIGWKRFQEKKGECKLSLAPNFLLLNWVSCPALEAQCTFVSCFLKSRLPYVTQIGGSGAVFAWLYA
jgi:hypothetical protein